MKQQIKKSSIEWKEVVLSEFAKCLNGFAFKSEKFNDEKKGIPLIRIRNLFNGKSETYYSGEYVKEYLVNQGDFLIGMDGEFKIFEWKSEKALLNQRVSKLLFDKEKITPKYIFYLINQKLKEIEDKTPFVTVKHISSKQIESIKIPLPFRNGHPDLETQKQIVSILEKAEQLKEKRKQAIKLLDEYVKSVFNEMFGDPSINPKKWSIKTIQEVALDKKGSIRMGPFGSQLKKHELVTEGVKVLWIENIVGNKFNPGGTKYITEEKYEQLKGFTINKGNLLITMMGTIGRVEIVPDIGKAIISSHLLKIEVNNKICDPIYLKKIIMSPFVQNQFKDASHGAIMSGLNGGIIKSTKIPLPPLPLQQTFASIVEHVEKLKEKQNKSLQEIEQLFNALMQKAFNGELVK
ncbi:restriction endonuclease subunit S [Candidatus Pacearchaeota archaeon]|nr:restriction endonuclease subunit S [Candidatus Pacearchaeota archaeon]